MATRPEALSLLMLGTVNHPHVEHLALAMTESGAKVTVGGDVEPSLPDSVLPQAGTDVHVAPPSPVTPCMAS